MPRRPVRVSEPCDRRWEELTADVADPTTRYCDACGRNVRFYSALGEVEAADAVRAGPGERVCLFGLADGSGRLLGREEVSDGVWAWLAARARAVAPLAAAASVLVQPGSCSTGGAPEPVDVLPPEPPSVVESPPVDAAAAREREVRRLEEALDHDMLMMGGYVVE